MAKIKEVEKIKHEPGNEEAWVCICGNTPDFAGFYPCDEKGKDVEPVAGEWDGVRFVCDQCKRIIDQNTLEVLGRGTL